MMLDISISSSRPPGSARTIRPPSKMRVPERIFRAWLTIVRWSGSRFVAAG
jgi:hypothetical protein